MGLGSRVWGLGFGVQAHSYSLSAMLPLRCGARFRVVNYTWAGSRQNGLSVTSVWCVVTFNPVVTPQTCKKDHPNPQPQTLNPRNFTLKPPPLNAKP